MKTIILATLLAVSALATGAAPVLADGSLSEEYLRVARLPSPRMEAADVAAAVREIVAFARPEIERFFQARVLGSDSLAMAIHERATDRLLGTCAFSQLDGDNGSA